MTDREIEQYVEGLADGVPHVDAPLGAVLAAGRVSAARRTRRRGAAVLAGVVAAVAAVAIGPQLMAGSSTAEPLPPVASSGAPVAPDGMKLVGADGVAIAVPQAWGQSQLSVCGQPREESYAIEQSLEIGCGQASGPEPETALWVHPGGGRPDDLAPELGCGQLGCFGSWALGGVGFRVFVGGEQDRALALVTTMGESLQRLPVGYATVPLWPLELYRTDSGMRGSPVPEARYESIVRAAGLSAAVRIVDATSRTTDPPQGSVVEVPDPDELAVAPGTRLVGADGVAIAVPEEWVSTDPPFCSEPEMPYVYVADPEAFYPSCPAQPGPPEPVSGLEISTTDNVRSTGEDLACDAAGCAQGWRVDGVSFSAYVAGPDRQTARDELEQIGATIAPVPDGYTTVPGWPSVETHPGPNTVKYGPIPRSEYVELVEAAGLVAVQRGGSGGSLTVRQVEPGYGSVVPVGSEVVVD
ncbi:hypothetical protein BH09ACT12_BH09ACT12_29770 [soil metagenome]